MQVALSVFEAVVIVLHSFVDIFKEINRGFQQSNLIYFLWTSYKLLKILVYYKKEDAIEWNPICSIVMYPPVLFFFI